MTKLTIQIEQRLDALESHNIFQEDVIDQLSGELAQHQAKITELKEQIKLMATRLKESADMPNEPDGIEPPPPHY